MKAFVIMVAYAIGAFLLGFLRPRRWIIVFLVLVAACHVDGADPTGLECVVYVEATFDGVSLSLPDTVLATECGS